MQRVKVPLSSLKSVNVSVLIRRPHRRRRRRRHHSRERDNRRVNGKCARGNVMRNEGPQTNQRVVLRP